MTVVVDTDVVSYIFKKDPKARLYRRHLIGQTWVISFMTQAELDNWALWHHWGQARREALEQHLQRFQIYYPDRDLCLWWAETVNRARLNGRPIQVADAWIAATALALGVPLVTHNAADYEGVDGLEIRSEPEP